jgi:hypothetical protein
VRSGSVCAIHVIALPGLEEGVQRRLEVRARLDDLVHAAARESSTT